MGSVAGDDIYSALGIFFEKVKIYKIKINKTFFKIEISKAGNRIS